MAYDKMHQKYPTQTISFLCNEVLYLVNGCVTVKYLREYDIF